MLPLFIHNFSNLKTTLQTVESKAVAAIVKIAFKNTENNFLAFNTS